MNIKDIAEIQIGYQFRGRIEPDPKGTHRVIQIKDMDDDRRLVVSDLYRITPDREPEKYLVRRGDVLFLSKGRWNTATPITIELDNAIAAGYFFILKVAPEKIDPEYLAWYINQEPAQSYLQKHARGTAMPIIIRAAFENLKIDLPPIEIQKKIVKLDGLMKKETEILRRIDDKRGKLIKAACLNAARRSK